jgi:hypothetical protein
MLAYDFLHVDCLRGARSQATENSIPGSDIHGGVGLSHRCFMQALMRTVPVIAAGELSQHLTQMPLAQDQDQDVIKALEPRLRTDDPADRSPTSTTQEARVAAVIVVPFTVR